MSRIDANNQVNMYSLARDASSGSSAPYSTDANGLAGIFRLLEHTAKVAGMGAGPLAGIAGSTAGLSSEQATYIDLLKEQNRIQLENQVFSASSNISKTEHETRMAAVRNMRA